ncbi:MAG: tyrosine-type recombinase/integrase [Rhodospirillales bacterium]
MRIYKRKGSSRWWAQWYDQNGHRHRKSTGTDDKALAQALAAKWQQDAFMEHHFGVIPDSSFQEALLRYAKERQRQNAQSYQSSLKYRLQFLLDRFGGLNLSQMSARLLSDFAEERLATKKGETVQKELSTIRAILNKAKREERLAVVPTFPRIRKEPGRCRWLTRNEEERLLAASARHLKPLIAFAVDTGGRRSELLELDWRDVDLAQGRITFRKTKNGEDRSIRLTSRAKAVLESLGPRDSGPVFTYGGKAMKDARSSFDRARKEAGLEDVRFHDLRHTFASRLVQQGVSLYEVMHLTGHKSVSMVQRYAHLAPDFQEAAIRALEAFGTKRAQPANQPLENVG